MTTPRTYFYRYLVLTLLVFVAGTAMVLTSHRSLEGLDLYTGQIEETKITTTRKDMSEKPRPVFYFTLKGLDAKFIISEGMTYDYSIYQNNLKPGDSVKVYYDARGYLTPEGYNPYVFQLEKGHLALLDLKKANASSKLTGYIVYGIGVLALIATIWFYTARVRIKK